MDRILVTGASGFIGGHVASALLNAGYQVRALLRPGSSATASGDGLEAVSGDVTDRASVAEAVRGCDGVVHAAALYAFWPPDPDPFWEVNVEGTRNVLEEAVAAGVERIVHTSTVATTHFRRSGLADESDIAQPRDLVGHYKRTKFEAERIALRMARQGAPIVIVNPAAPVGPGDVKPTPTGQIIVDFLNRRIPAVVDTGLNIVDVADVAAGHVLALEKGRAGERYLLASADGNVTLKWILDTLADGVGVPAPRWRIPYAVAIASAYADTLIEGRLLRRKPRIPLEGARIARTRMWVDPSKSVRELGMPQSDVRSALLRAATWFEANGYVSSGQPLEL